MKLAVITFPGSNCDHDLIYVLRQHLGLQVLHLWHKDTDLQGADWVLLPGGFAHGDYLRPGAMARFSPIMAEVNRHAQRGGYVLGVCNGFQILTEAGLLPGALVRNHGTRFISAEVALVPACQHLLPPTRLARQAYRMPIAHADGCYYADAATLAQLQEHDQILFKYVNADAQATPEANPNGSALNIAGVTNSAHNVMALMPHPERAADPLLGMTDGLTVLKALLNLN